MASERKFIYKAILDYGLKEFLNKELANAGVSHIEIQKTPIATRIAIHVRRPGFVVGKKGKTIREVSEVLQETYGVENPQIEVIEVSNPSLNAKLMAEKIGRQLEIRGNAKTAMRFALREIMAAGAIGAEIHAAGKLAGKGAKAKQATVRAGYLKKSGEQAKKVHVQRFTAYLKAGAIGITVKIVQPGTVFSDSIDISSLKDPGVELAALQAPETEAKQVEKAPEKKKSAKRRPPRRKTTGPKTDKDTVKLKEEKPMQEEKSKVKTEVSSDSGETDSGKNQSKVQENSTPVETDKATEGA